MVKKAIILLSGGLDSATCLAMATAEGLSCFALSFAYGQRSHSEVESAKRIAQQFSVTQHKIFQIDLAQFGGSALTDKRIAVPETISSTITTTYVPARNTIFLSYALAFAEVIGAQDIFIGANADDYASYPDCRPAFIQAFTDLAQVATKAGVQNSPLRIQAPLIRMYKADIIRAGLQLGVDYAITCSCYAADDQGRACRCCESCQLRARGFMEAGVEDPTRYVARINPEVA